MPGDSSFFFFFKNLCSKIKIFETYFLSVSFGVRTLVPYSASEVLTSLSSDASGAAENTPTSKYHKN